MSALSQSALQAETEARLLFEILLADVCAQFVNVAPRDIDSKIASAQRVICESLKVDHSSVWQVAEENPDTPVMTRVYPDPDLKPLPLRTKVQECFPWSSRKILNKEMVCVPNTARLPPEAAMDKESWEEYGIHSSLVIPLSVGGGPLIGILAFDNMEEREWPEPLQRRLQILAHVFAQALDRKDAEDKLRESENRFRLVADIAPVLMWMSGSDKLCTYFNKPWLDFTGRSMEEELGNGWAEGVHPDDLQRCLDTYQQFFDRREKFKMEYRLRYHGGGYRWILDIGVPRFNQDGAFAGYIGIGVDISQSKEAEQRLHAMNRALEEQTAVLQSREELLKIFVKNVPAGVAMFDRDMRYLQVSDRWCADYSVDSSQILGRSHYDVFPDIPQRWKEIHRRALAGETLRADEDRWDHEGCTRWIRWETRPWKMSSGLVEGMLIFAEDITKRKQIEEALTGMSRKLLRAQEQERGRIARELHDDINQRLAMLAIDLQQLQDNPSEVTGRVQELRKRTTDISHDLQALSHDLHSSQLEYLGAVAGIRSWCKEFGERQGMQIDCRQDVRGALPQEIGLCLFRVLQEALQNAAKHSGVKRIEVQLQEESSELHLIVRDSGRGFDVEAVKQGKGLGLTSMQERIRLVNGTITIDSKLGDGTTIRACVPLESKLVAPKTA